MSPRSKTFRLGLRRTGALLPCLALTAFCLSACEEPPVDSNTPAPAGVMEGTVTYLGPRPTCEYDENTGVPLKAVGRVILTLFEYDNPPPPEGSATSALNLLAIPGDQLFSNLAQVCLPQGATPTPGEIISTSVDFTWPELPLGTGRPVSYRVTGFYDYDQSFNPFFSITQSPTAGDMAGAAVVDPLAASPEIARIEFGTQAQYPAGQLVSNVSVTLGLHIDTEPPIFYGTSTNLGSESSFVPSLSGTAKTEEELLVANETVLHLYPNTGTPADVELLDALSAANLTFDFGAGKPEYAWYVRGVDVDGVAGTDNHPLYAGAIAEFKHLFPIVLLRRRMNTIETASGVPTVIMMTIVPQNVTSEIATPYAEGQVVFPDIRVAVPPLAVAITNSALGEICRVPIFAPGSAANLFTNPDTGAPIVAECQELPTGRYEYTALNGLAGTAGFTLPGQFSNQNWTAPNALGDPAQFIEPGTDPNAPIPTSCADSRCAIEQSLTNAFLVHDTDAATYGARRRDGDTACATSNTLFGQNVPIPDPSWNEPGVNAFIAADPNDEFETVEQVQAACCEPIRHLCDVPLCPAETTLTGETIYGAPTSATEIDWDGERRQKPNCVSFLMPRACCDVPVSF